jgi:RNA polymerase sigma factor (TIGR02999 family)
MAPKHNAGAVTRLLISWSAGDRNALDELAPLIYDELRRVAASYLRRERREHTMQPTALVHETWVRLVDQKVTDCRTRAQFFAIAANLMRQILVNHAKRRNAAKRSGGSRITLDEAGLVVQNAGVDLIELNNALDKLGEIDPRQSRIVELRFFGGLTEAEIAEALDVSPVTVRRDWRIARAVLYSHLTYGILDDRTAGT